MGYQALLSDNSIIQPAVDVLEGIITPVQANRTYKGVTGKCPHCLALRDTYAESMSASLRNALSTADLTVGYRCAHIVDGSMLRIMHFAHRPGFMQTDAASALCRGGELAYHAAALEVIASWASTEWYGGTIRKELRVTIPGAPPETFRPDCSIYAADGTPVACIEYQRSMETFDNFRRRHEVRLQEFPNVLWFFETGIYGRSPEHRRYLAKRAEPFFRCWVDAESGRLVAEPGRPPSLRHRVEATNGPEKCSIASLINAYERQEFVQVVREQEMHGINTSLPMQVSKGAERAARPAPSTPSSSIIPWPPGTPSNYQMLQFTLAHLGLTPTRSNEDPVYAWLQKHGRPMGRQELYRTMGKLIEHSKQVSSAGQLGFSLDFGTGD